MKLTRFGASAAAACAAVALTMGAATPALADGDAEAPDAEALATAAQAAADATNQAFIDADWDEVLAQADAFDGLYAELAALLAGAQAAHTSSGDALALLRGELTELKDARTVANAANTRASNDRRNAKNLRDDLTDEASDLDTTIADLDAQIAQAVADLGTAEAPADGTLHGDLAAANARVGVAEAAWVQSVGGGLWLTLVLNGYGNPSLDDAFDLRAKKQAELDDRQGRDDCGLWGLTCQTLLSEIANLSTEIDARDGEAVKQELADARADVPVRENAIAAAQSVIAQLEADRDAAAARLALLRFGTCERDDAGVPVNGLIACAEVDFQVAKDIHRGPGGTAEVLAAARAAVTAKEGEISVAEGADADALAAVELLQALLNGLATAQQDVADRRADLADYRKAESEIVWGTDAAPGVAKPGDVVTVDFTVPGSADYDLSGVTVAVTSPAGLSPVCDIADDGVVPAGGSVACTVEYEVQQADVETGSVTFEVVLEGFLPLGPGNPRSTNVTKTKIVASHSLTFDVEALPVIDTVVPEDVDDTPSEPTDEGTEDATDETNEDEVQTDSPAETTSAVVTESDSDDTEQQTTATEALPTTGGDLGLVLPAGILVALGTALLISRRFLQA